MLCRYSLGWLRLLHHCIALAANDPTLSHRVVSSAASVPELLRSLCGLLLVPAHIPSLYLPNLEKVLRELALFSRENGAAAIEALLRCEPRASEPINLIQNTFSTSSLTSSCSCSCSSSACELLYRVCRHRDEHALYRVGLLLGWLGEAARAGRAERCPPAYVACVARVVWAWRGDRDLPGMITDELFSSLYELIGGCGDNLALKRALDSVLCAFCYVKSELFPALLQRMGVLVPILSTDHGASISDDRSVVISSEGVALIKIRYHWRNLHETLRKR